MAADKAIVDPALAAYCAVHSTPPDALQRRLIAETADLGGRARMQITAEQGVLLEMLARVSRARFAVEVGTFTGYSALCIARALPDDGRLVACDVSEEWTAIGRRYWEEAGVGHKIDLRLGPGLDTLRSLPADRAFDFAFIDADKSGYLAYFEEILGRLRPGGLVAVDNTLWSGRVLDEEPEGDTAAIMAFNDAVAADPRVDVVVLPLADGVSLLRKR